MVSADRLGRGDAAHALHAYVHQHDIGPFALALEQRLLAIFRFGDDDQARHAADHLRQACTHHHVIVDQQDAHRLGQFARRLGPGLALGAVRRRRLLLLFHHSDARSNRCISAPLPCQADADLIALPAIWHFCCVRKPVRLSKQHDGSITPIPPRFRAGAHWRQSCDNPPPCARSNAAGVHRN